MSAIMLLSLVMLAQATNDPESRGDQPYDVEALSEALIFQRDEPFQQALDALVERGELDVTATMILALRYRPEVASELVAALTRLTGQEGEDWADFMLWQESHPEVAADASFYDLKARVYSLIDPNFLQFLEPEWIQPERMKIRLEEVTWGGVEVDGIPSLDHPKMLPAPEATYLADDDLVFGVEIHGDARAYPLRIMGWHEMFNDVIGGVPVALAYCTLCGSGILFETRVEGRDEPLVFGSSGLLYRSNKLMFDRATSSLWNQYTGRPVIGPLVESGIALTIRPVVITSWARWRTNHPDTQVLSRETGHDRDYGSGVVYREYFDSPDLMFPTHVDQERLRQKDYVFGLRDGARVRAWPLSRFAGGAVLNDVLGTRPVVLIGDAATRTVRAYARGEGEFTAGEHPGTLRGPGGIWSAEEDALVGPHGERLARLPGHISYWFAWDGYLGANPDSLAR